MFVTGSQLTIKWVNRINVKGQDYTLPRGEQQYRSQQLFTALKELQTGTADSLWIRNIS
jgi:hypothetical protein